MGDVDYRRYGRQIALPEVGAAGQRSLASTAVRFVPAFGADDVVARAEQLHRRAGGIIDDSAEVVLRVPRVRTMPAQLGVAAACAIEAARRVLGQPARDVPDELVAQLDELGENAP